MVPKRKVSHRRSLELRISLLLFVDQQFLNNVWSNFLGTRVSTDSTSDGCWAALVVTPIMRRAHSLDSSSDIIFVNSTSSCDATKIAAIVLLTATKAGAVPTAVLLHNSQTTEGYVC